MKDTQAMFHAICATATRSTWTLPFPFSFPLQTYLSIAVCLGFMIASTPANADATILVQSTTSTKNSGLYDDLLPKIKADTQIQVRVVAVGTGQAIKNARNCDGDVLLVHAKAAEQQFVADGYGTHRYDLMYNDFVLVGAKHDPARVKSTKSAAAALKLIARANALFASRGDDSGTHKKEKALWQSANLNPTLASGKWYRETGSGMGATLNTAIGMGAYTLTDRATWITFKNKRDFQIVLEGDPSLFNQYGIILVNPQKCPTTQAKHGQRVIDWLLSKKGQAAIANYKRDGQQLFFPNAQ